MNPADHYTAVGYTHREIAEGQLMRIADVPVQAVGKADAWARSQTPVMRNECEVCNVPKDDQQLTERLHRFLGTNPGDYAQIMFVNDDTMGIAEEYGLVFPHLLGRFAGEELLANIGGFGPYMRGTAFTSV
jgi:hypothetical protein